VSYLFLRKRINTVFFYLFLEENNLVTKKGDRLKCDACGAVVVFDEACGCAECDIICCEKPMKKIG